VLVEPSGNANGWRIWGKEEVEGRSWRKEEIGIRKKFDD
jgi:hypothetical protein